MEIAVATGERTAKGLTKKDSVLANALREKGEMSTFILQRGNFGRRSHYASLTKEDLLAHAVNISKKMGFEYLYQVQAMDSPLYDAFREHQLTTAVADQAGFKGSRRKTSGRVRRPRIQRETKKTRYAAMTDDALFETVRETETTNSSNLIKHNCTLYTEMMKRPNVRRRLVDLGWRRAPVRWEDMVLKDWVELCSQFETKSGFRSGYTAGYAHALKSGLWDKICETLTLQDKWQGIYGFDGRSYQSRAECIVANWLHHSSVSYKPHPLLPWKARKQRYRADFILNDYPIWIEVFLCSGEGLKCRSDAPSWAPEYIKTRKLKELYYASHPEKKLLTIEAEIYRYEGKAAYLSHIREVFEQFGIKLVDPSHVRLDLGNDRRGMFWSLEEFLDYAETHKITKLFEFQNEGHRDLYTVLASRGMRDELGNALCNKHGRFVPARKKSQLTIDELKTVCQKLNIRTKTQYQAAHKARKLPTGAPSCIRQNYRINWAVFFNGKGWAEFWSWEKAREYVRSRGFRNREEFVRAVRMDHDMKYIRRNPGNPISGGYPEFVDWYDFLGKIRPTSPPLK